MSGTPTQHLPSSLPPLQTAPPSRRSTRFLPFRRTPARTRNSGEAVAVLVIRILEARNLNSDRPFVQVRLGSARTTSVTAKGSNPVFKETKLEITIHSDAVELGNSLLEAVVFDKDIMRKEYLGEVSIAANSFFRNGFEFIALADPNNQPRWYDLRSSRPKNTKISGQLLIQFGFIPLPSAVPSSTLSDPQLDRIRSVLFELTDRTEGKRRVSKELELYTLTSPVDSFGTVSIEDGLNYISESESSESESEGVNALEQENITESDTQGEVTDSESSTSSETEDEEEDINDFAAPPILVTSTDTLIPSSALVVPALPSPPLSPPYDSTLPPFSAPSFPALPRQTSLPSMPSPPIYASPPPTIVSPPSSGPRKGPRGLSIPKFMKRNSSSKKAGSNVDTESDVPSGAGSSSPLPPITKEKKRRFSRKKKSSLTDTGGIESEKESSGKVGKEVKRRKSKKSKKRGMIDQAIIGASLPSVLGSSLPSTPALVKNRRRLINPTRLGRRKTRSYNFNSSETSYGLVQIEIKSARNLPVWSNTLRTSFDMDPFVVISFGKKVFRTRVIRHSLNPEWNEKLFFHVTKSEERFLLNFDVLDWDITTSNDNVGSISISLAELFDGEVGVRKNLATGLYETIEGKLVGDKFIDKKLKISTVDGSAASSKKLDNEPELYIRAKFTPYDALRQQFFEIYLKQYDIDDSGSFSHLEIFSMLDSLGSTLTKETIATFFTRFGKSVDQELSSEQVIICLEAELRKPELEKRPIPSTSGLITPSILSSYSPSGSHTPVSLNPSRPSTPSPLINSYGYFVPHLGSEEEVESLLKHLEKNEEVTVVLPEAVVDSDDAKESSNESESFSAGLAAGADLRRSESTEMGGPAIERVINIKACPLCHKPRMNSRAEVDIITHMAICAADPGSINRIVVGSFVTAPDAQRKFFTKAIAKVTKGAYSLGANSANIIVQDRRTGALVEEKMAVYVRLGMRLAYKGFGAGGAMEGARIRKLLESMSIKQGIKFDSPASALEILPFIKFHNLDLTEILEPKLSNFRTFNEFFYRKLKPEVRPIDDPTDPNTLVSPADCRAMFFETITDATKFWVKGNSFSIAKLLGEGFKEKAKLFAGGSMGIFRLAPQDYHRYHSPVDGICQKYIKISGRYYTVNPQGVRSAIDIFGENVRGVQPILSPVFGETMHIWVGAMMVGSINMTVKEGDEVKRGQELGYFSFGGSTIIVLFQPGVVTFDEDLLANSRNSTETLVRMGTRVGRRTGT